MTPEKHEGGTVEDSKVVVLSKKELWKVLKRVFNFSSSEFVNLSLGTLSLFVNSLTNLYFPYAIGKAVDSAAGSSSISSADVRGPSFFFISGAIASFLRVYNFGLVKERSASRLKAALMSNCLRQDLNFFDEVGTGELLTTLDKDVVITADIFSEKIPAALRSLNSSLAGSVFLFRVSPYLCAVSLSTIPIVGIVAIALGKTSNRLTSTLRELEKQQSVFASERFSNIATVFVNGMQAKEQDAFDAYSQQILSQSNRKYFINGVKMSFINIATNASILAVLYTGASMVARGDITQGELTAFLMRSGFVGLGFSSMSTVFSDLRASLTSAARVFSYIDAKKAVESSQGGDQATILPLSPPENSEDTEDTLSLSCYVDLSLTEGGGSSPQTQLRHTSSDLLTTPIISFRDVVFAYPSRPQHACLKAVSVDISSQSVTAFAGASGAGKSSMLALMCALHKPVSGQLSIADTHLSTCSDGAIEELRKKIAVVQQSSVLFSGSIAYNIGYGMPFATREDIEDVARMVFSHEFIAGMVEGYDTEVGEGGCRLSGGQRQRVALCRALLRDPDILILDEPSSSLDCENEDSLINLLMRLKKTKCIVVFTHSPAIMAAADTLHFLEEGAIVESGSFSTLKHLDRFKHILQSASTGVDDEC